MDKYDSIRAALTLDSLSIQGDSLGNLTDCFLRQASKSMREATTNGRSLLGKVHQRYVSALQQFIESEYLSDRKKTLDEVLVGCDVRKSAFLEYKDELLVNPYRALLSQGSSGIYSAFSSLSGTVHAINKTKVIDLVGKCGGGVLRFILDVCGLTEINYSFQPFNDPYLETLYSNDGIILTRPEDKKYVNLFFRFFIDGDADYSKEFSSESYYGSLPVSVDRVKSFCEKKAVPSEYSEKLLAIVRCSSRFETSKDEEVIKYSLKVQYLNNYLAMSVAILFKEGKPLHKEELKDRIDTLHTRYPSLVDSYAIESFVIRRKPILCAAGAQGEWGLRIWKTNAPILDSIRTFVAQEYSEKKRPISLDVIVSAMQSEGYTYDNKTIQTYVTKSGCKSLRKGLYLPPDTVESGDTRYWIGKKYLIQRYAAKCLLASGRAASRKIIREYICREAGHVVNMQTFERAIQERPDLFSVTGTGKRDQQIVLSDSISVARDVNQIIPEPEKKEPDYVKDVRKKIVDYLFGHTDALQRDLKEIFVPDLPKHLKSRESIIGRILSDKDFFIKQEVPDGVRVSLNSNYRKRVEIERQAEILAPQIQEMSFSWGGLKTGVMKQLLSDEIDEKLSDALEKVFLVFRCGEDNMPLNSSFDGMVKKLFRYVTADTSPEDRRELQEGILKNMEAFLREFYYLKYGDLLQSIEGFGGLKHHFRDIGLFPDKDKTYLPEEEMAMYRIIESINRQRNKIIGHPGPLTEQSDKQSTKDIHDCLSLMVYLGEKF